MTLDSRSIASSNVFDYYECLDDSNVYFIEKFEMATRLCDKM